MMDYLFLVCLIFIFAFIYFIPTFLANDCSHRKFKTILVFNILLGWTVIGWAIAVIWACTGNNHNKEKELLK